ncbi:MAG: winged helix-turn-helix transcriptional regulator [Candidatus Verstraetearchaeota archaeon]|nr:winged helix-turn-helix transcriptional regulator [Candidatus Verstraetearchaeota archaeon]
MEIKSMLKGYENLMEKILELLKRNPGQSIKEIAKQLKVNRSFAAGYLQALEDQGYVKSKKIGPARIYFLNRPGE